MKSAQVPRTERPDPLVVLRQGEGWAALAKPPGVVVHRNALMRHEYAVLQRARDTLGCRVWPVHRLDRPTSGVLLFATERSLAGPLHQALTAEDSTKTYVAFVRGCFPHDGPLVVETPIPDGEGGHREARSVVTCIGRSEVPRCSLLRVEPRTGRTHQVRRHVRDLHHPIIHDGDHGDSRVNRWWRENHGVRRIGLHALTIDFQPPAGERLQVVCPLFDDQAALWATLPWWSAALKEQPELGLPPLPLPADVLLRFSERG
jgi:tRNA pseudouridine65 synthase